MKTNFDPFQSNVNYTISLFPFEGENGIEGTALLPEDAINIIFQKMLRDLANLPTLALVCKKWKTAIDDESFRINIRPKQTFGREEWQGFLGVDSGKERPLPRCAYSDLENKEGYLIFIPKKVTRVNLENLLEVIVLDNLEVIENLFGLQIASIQKKKRFTETSHWTWLGKKILGVNKTYLEQQKEAEESKAKISGLIDTVITMFVRMLKSGSQVIEGDLTPATEFQLRLIEQDKFNKGLCIHGQIGDKPLICHVSREKKNEHLGFLLARKSF